MKQDKPIWILAEEVLDSPVTVVAVIREEIQKDPFVKFMIQPRGMKPSEFLSITRELRQAVRGEAA